jgi:hypothetical protein
MATMLHSLCESIVRQLCTLAGESLEKLSGKKKSKKNLLYFKKFFFGGHMYAASHAAAVLRLHAQCQ